MLGRLIGHLDSGKLARFRPPVYGGQVHIGALVSRLSPSASYLQMMICLVPQPLHFAFGARCRPEQDRVAGEEIDYAETPRTTSGDRLSHYGQDGDPVSIAVRALGVEIVDESDRIADQRLAAATLRDQRMERMIRRRHSQTDPTPASGNS